MLLFASAASFSPLSAERDLGGRECFCCLLGCAVVARCLSLPPALSLPHSGLVLYCAQLVLSVQQLASVADQEHCPFPDCPCLPYHEEPLTDPVRSNPKTLDLLPLGHFE